MELRGDRLRLNTKQQILSSLCGYTGNASQCEERGSDFKVELHQYYK